MKHYLLCLLNCWLGCLDLVQQQAPNCQMGSCCQMLSNFPFDKLSNPRPYSFRFFFSCIKMLLKGF